MNNEKLNNAGSGLWLKNPLAVYSAELYPSASEGADATNGIVVKGDKIIELVGRGQSPSHAFTHSIDCSEYVITPGLINTHHHFYQTLTRCLPDALNKPLFPWLKTLYKVWQNLDESMLSLATRLACMELMLSGTTTVSDHHYVFPKGLDNAIDIQAECLSALGCRGLLTRGSMSLGESDGGLPPDSVIQPAQTILDDSRRLVNSYHQREDGAMLQIALAPCSPFSVTQELMIETAKLAEELDVLTHTHLAETEDENTFCVREYGMRPLDYLEQCGWLNARSWLAHGIHFNAEEIKRLGKARVGIAHCPSSNGLLASGICPTLDLQQAGCPVGLAVDGSASNDCSNMIQETRQSLLQQRLRYGAQRITAETVLGFATKGSASVMRRDDIGEIALGKQADLAFFKLEELRFSGAGDPIAALVLCGAQQVDRLMVAGKWLIEDAKHVDELEQELMRLHQQASKKLTNCS